MQIETVPIDSIREYENNAKLHPQEQIEQIKLSIEQFGNNDPIAIDQDGVIIAGHGRYKALRQLGYEEIPVIRLSHLTEEQKRAYILVHNKLTMNTGFDMEMLALELNAITDIDMGEFDFDLEALDLEGIGGETDEVREDDDFDPTPPEEPKSKRGQLYRLGEHYLICGDSTDANDIKKLMHADGSRCETDLVMTDPPYGVSYTGKTDDALTIQNDSMQDGELEAFLTAAFKNADEYLKPGASFYIWHASSTVMSFIKAMRNVEWKDRQQIIWNKNTMVLGRQDFQWKHEPALYGWKSGASHNWYSDRSQTTVLDFDKPARNGDHPTMKPIPLIAYCIECSSKKGDVVYEPFGGSGTTLLAAEQLGRKCRCCELDERYVDVIIRRWEEFTGKTAELIAGPGSAEDAAEGKPANKQAKTKPASEKEALG